MIHRNKPLTSTPGNPPVAAAQERMRAESARSLKFLIDHQQEFLERYPGQYVGVYLEELVAVDSNYATVCARLDALGIPKSSAAIRFMGQVKAPRVWTLWKTARRRTDNAD